MERNAFDVMMHDYRAALESLREQTEEGFVLRQQVWKVAELYRKQTEMFDAVLSRYIQSAQDCGDRGYAMSLGVISKQMKDRVDAIVSEYGSAVSAVEQ